MAKFDKVCYNLEMMKKASQQITKKERRFVIAFANLRKSKGCEPTIAELTRTLGYKSPSSVRQFMDSLNRKGINYRSVDISAPLAKKQLKSTYLIPVLGCAPCGKPLFAEENIEDYLEVDSDWIRGNPKDFFILQAKGNSLDRVGIDDGDYVLFRSQSTANPGEKVVALIDDEATIKFFKPTKEYVALVPKSSDPSHRPIIMKKDFMIQGVVKGVIKKESLNV